MLNETINSNGIAKMNRLIHYMQVFVALYNNAHFSIIFNFTLLN